MAAFGRSIPGRNADVADRSTSVAHYAEDKNRVAVTHRHSLLTASILFLFLCCPTIAADRPNIVLILADDVGCEPIGAYGGERWKTPNVDALAASGVMFDYCFSMPVCHPSRMALMTGRYPFRTKAKWGSFPKDEEQHSIGAVLQRAGYRTAVAGKWQLSLMKKDLQQPKRMGFDEWSLFGWHEGARYHEPFIYEDGELRTDTKGKYGPDLYVEFLNDFMDRSVRDDEPFFAYYSMALAHDVTDDIPVQVPYVPGKDRWMDYGEMIASMDEMVGRVVAKIDDLGVRDNTVILFTGDNGTASRSKLRHISGRKYEYESVYSIRNGDKVPGGKGSLKDTGTNVPLIASWPGKIPAGKSCEAIVDFTDWLPTVAELAGADNREDLDGISFASMLSDPQKPSPRKFAFAESRRGKAWVRTKRFKLYKDGRFADLAVNPKELDLRKDVPEKARDVYEALRRQLENLGLAPTSGAE